MTRWPASRASDAERAPMKQLINILGGVLAIVGLGFFAGVGQSLLRDAPVIVGVAKAAPASNAENTATDTQLQDQPDGSGTETDIETGVDTNPSGAVDDPDFNARLDAPVPDGMLTLRQAHQRWIDGAYFIDARHKEEYDLGRVSGAAHLNAETFFTKAGEAEMQTIPPDAPVVVYCVGGLCDASENTVALLTQFGYSDLSIMGVGYDDWEAAGLPTDSSTSSDDLESEGSP